MPERIQKRERGKVDKIKGLFVLGIVKRFLLDVARVIYKHITRNKNRLI